MKSFVIIFSILLLGSLFGIRESFASEMLEPPSDKYTILHQSEDTITYVLDKRAADLSYELASYRIFTDTVERYEQSDEPIDYNSKVTPRLQQEINDFKMYLDQRVSPEKLDEIYYEAVIVGYPDEDTRLFLPDYVIDTFRITAQIFDPEFKMILPEPTPNVVHAIIPLDKFHELGYDENIRTIQGVEYDAISSPDVGSSSSQDVTFVMPDDYYISPLKQTKNGIISKNVECNEEYQLIVKTSNDSPACVTSSTFEKLIQRSWGYALN